MSWTDKIPSFTPIKWAGISLFALNIVLFPFSVTSEKTVYHEDGEHPAIEILVSNTPEPHEPTPHATISHEPMHPEKNTHVADNQNIHPTKVSNEHGESAGHGKHMDSSEHTTEHSQPKTIQHDTAINVHPDRMCYELGPLKTDDEQIKLQSIVEAKGMFVSVKYNQSHENLGYWVFIPPLRSNALGRLKVEELKLKGFKDVVLLTKNQPINAVSIGVFQDQKNAYKQLLKAQSKGFDAKMDIRYKSLGEMWLSIEVSKHKDLDDAGWGGLLTDYPHVQLHAVNCP